MFDAPELVAFDSQLAEIDQKLAGLQAQRDALLVEQSRVSHLRAVYVAARAPWRRLPFELISEIFVGLLVEETSSRSLAAYTLPTTISLVSREWRTIALSDPRLWSSVKINAQRGSQTAQTWLERSKSAPATLTYHLYEYMRGYSYQRALEQIRDHRHHIFDLEIITDTNERCINIIKALNHPFPVLHALSVRGDDRVVIDAEWTLPDELVKRVFGGGGCPNLRSLNVISSYSWLSGLFGNLTKLTFLDTGSDPTLRESRVLRLLEHTPSVTDVTVRLDHLVYPLDGTLSIQVPEPITLLAITCLTIDGFFDDVIGFLSCLHLPNLRSLTIHHDIRLWDPTTWVLPDAMTTFPLLERFQFTMGFVFDETITEFLPYILRRCDNLRELHIGDTLEPLVALVDHLDTLDGKEQPMCPRLEHLRIEQSKGFGIFNKSEDPIRDFLSSRTNPEGTSMRRLRTLSFQDHSRDNDFIEQAALYRPSAKSVYYNGIKL